VLREAIAGFAQFARRLEPIAGRKFAVLIQLPLPTMVSSAPRLPNPRGAKRTS